MLPPPVKAHDRYKIDSVRNPEHYREWCGGVPVESVRSRSKLLVFRVKGSGRVYAGYYSTHHWVLDTGATYLVNSHFRGNGVRYSVKEENVDKWAYAPDIEVKS